MDLGFKCDSDKDVSHMNFTPSLQERLYESKKSTPSTSIAGRRMVHLFAGDRQLNSITAQTFRRGLKKIVNANISLVFKNNYKDRYLLP